MLGARASIPMLLFGALLLGGCHVRAAEPVGYVELTSAPPNVYSYPSVVYQGRPTYWVNGQWMYEDRGRWHYYRQEPPDLYRRRPYVQQAPPAYYQHAPPTYPPPAVRVQ